MLSQADIDRQNEQDTMYVRYLGTKICYTILHTGKFYMAEKEEATEEELALCEQGGGELPVSFSIRILAC